MKNRKHNNLCIKCKKKIDDRAKRCKSCSRIGKLNPNFDNHKLKGKNNPMFGKHHTEKTKKKISKMKIELGLKGDKNPNYNPNSKTHNNKCPDCGKHISFNAKFCRKHYGIGNRNHQWLGGKSFEPYNSKFTGELKKQIHSRDNFECQCCGISNQNHIDKYLDSLCIHHIDYNKKNNEIKNLISLCYKCHAKTNYRRAKWMQFFLKKY